MKSTKPANMKRVTRSATNIDQRGDRDLNSDGMRNGSSQSAKAQGYAGNQHSGVQNPNKTFNMGRGPTKGLTGTLMEKPKTPPTSSVPASIKIKNPDYINGGAQVRTPGGTRSFEPSGTQNYKGNCDAMNVGRGPTKGNAQGPAK